MLLEHSERLLNRCIAESTRAQECRQRLRGRKLGVAIRGVPFDFTLAVDDDRVRVQFGITADADVRIETGLLEALALLEADSIESLRSTGAKIRGDLHVADDFGALLRHAKPDVEEELSRWLGDVPAHALATLARRTVGWAHGARMAGEQNVADFLKSESRLLADPLEAARFAREVERIRDDVARLEQRLERLIRSTAQRTG
jgi:ubiquinone biosynthesis accessory factor UbiJ